MASKFITNDENGITLTNLIKSTINISDSLDFLVGYFFFSGFGEIYKDIKDKHLRILIGMNADVDVHNAIFEYTTYNNQKSFLPSIQNVQNEWIENSIKIINNADFVDTKINIDAYKLFKQKLLEGTLEIRKTKEPNHAKMYLFSLPEEQQILNQNPGKVIIGSSNFSYQGFRSRNEINVFLQDSYDYRDAKTIFDNLWAEAFPLTGDQESNENLIEQIEKFTWIEQRPSPYLLYIRTLYEYFRKEEGIIKTPKELTRDRMNQYFDVAYQTDAIQEGVYKIKKHSGVIIADVVGLGKSIIPNSQLFVTRPRLTH